MAKLTKDFNGVLNGDIYPTFFAKGDECPDELVLGAVALGALPSKADEKPAAKKDDAK